jgi:hypothetical protein
MQRHVHIFHWGGSAYAPPCVVCARKKSSRIRRESMKQIQIKRRQIVAVGWRDAACRRKMKRTACSVFRRSNYVPPPEPEYQEFCDNCDGDITGTGSCPTCDDSAELDREDYR